MPPCTFLAVHEPPGPHDPDNLIVPALLDACPSFAPLWREHLAAFPDAEGHLPYVALGTFATHLVAQLEGGKTEEFGRVFSTVERLWRDGDDGIRYAIKVGLLEDLGNVASNRMGWPFASRFRAWFGPHANAAWDELHREWGTSDFG